MFKLCGAAPDGICGKRKSLASECVPIGLGPITSNTFSRGCRSSPRMYDAKWSAAADQPCWRCHSARSTSGSAGKPSLSSNCRKPRTSTLWASTMTAASDSAIACRPAMLSDTHAIRHLRSRASRAFKACLRYRLPSGSIATGKGSRRCADPSSAPSQTSLSRRSSVTLVKGGSMSGMCVTTRDVDGPIHHRFGNLAAQRAMDRNLDIRIGRLEAGQGARQQKCRVKIRTSEHDAPRHFVRTQAGARFVVQLEQLARIGEQRLAM